MRRWSVLTTRSPLMAASLWALGMASSLLGQVFTPDQEQLTQYTMQNPFDRFADGRPKVPDELLAKLHDMSAEELLGLQSRGYRNQWEAGWQGTACNRLNQHMLGSFTADVK